MMRRWTFGVVTFVLLLSAAGAARGQQQSPEVCENKVPPDPAYFADMKELPPGRFGFSYLNDRAQFDDKSVPVTLNSVSAINSPRPRALKLSCVEVLNRTARVVRAVGLRWNVRSRVWKGDTVEDGEILAKGVLPLVEVEVPAGGTRKVEMRGVHFADFFQPLAAAGEINGTFHVTLGIARVEFIDGTSIDLP